MAKVALITLYIYNYGSILQAYSTKTFLEKNGFTPVLIRKDPEIFEEYEVEESKIRHPEFINDFNGFMESLKHNDSLVPEQSLQKMAEFVENTLQVKTYTMDQLKRAAVTDEFDNFIIGSDQVWNTTVGMVSEFYFLRFAPPQKRIALCPSFGADTVHDYLREDLAEVLNEYERLSSREDEGAAIIKDLTGREVPRLSDPTIFLTAEEWKDFAGTSDGDETGYLMLHFLDRPNETAIKNIKHIVKNTGMPVKCFTDMYEEFSDIEGMEHVTGGPREYIKAIVNAELVCTDSFHTSIFSINLGTDFFTFDRQYVHGVSQISRIRTLLKRYGLSDRLIMGERLVDTDDMAITVDTEPAKTQERAAISEYLLDALGKKKEKEIDLSGAKEIGRGQCGIIYRTGDDHVIKLFYDNIPKETIMTEYERTRGANEMNINSVKCYGLVSNKGRIGIEMDLVKGDNLHEEVLKNRSQTAYYGRKMAEELKLIHSKDADVKIFPPISDFYLECAKNCCRDGWISSEEEKKISAFIRAIPQSSSMIHGDYHVLNVMWEDGNIRLIDMANCMSGHPIFDLLISNLYMHFVPVHLEDLCSRFYRITPEEVLSLWDAFVRRYFETEDEEKIAYINHLLDLYSMLRIILAPYSYKDMTMGQEEYKRFVESGRRVLMPEIEKYTGVLP